LKKILHIIENFNNQAIEKWLYAMMDHITQLEEKVDWTFYSTLGKPGIMDEAVRELGGKIVYSPVPINNKLQFLWGLRKCLYEGRYDILHCHHDILSAVYLIASFGLPLKKRIVHIHNTSLSLPTTSALKHALFFKPMRYACFSLADNFVGVSKEALDSILNGVTPKSGRDKIIHCGIDLSRFHRKTQDRSEFIQTIGFPANAKILLFVGRMIEYKNPSFILDILRILTKLDSTICAIFLGSGPLEYRIRKLSIEYSLMSKVRVLGWCEDVPSFMNSSDILICPTLEHPREALGLGVIEAQAAGLPILMSLSIPKEAIVFPKLIEILPLAIGAENWAHKILEILKTNKPNKIHALEAVKKSSFSIDQSAANIQALYKI
jgi:glycosyltransferase involved in cell wall biosynthesis